MNAVSKYILIAVVVLVLAVAGFFGFKFFQYQKAIGVLPNEQSPIVFYENGSSGQYWVRERVLTKTVDTTRADGVSIYETVQSPLNIEEKIVLGTIPELEEGMFLGLARPDETILLLLTGGTNKAELAVRKDGLIVVVTSTPPPPSEPSLGVEGEESTVPEEHGFVENPVDDVAFIPVSVRTNYPELLAIEIDTGKITSLGAGRNPRFTEDGSVIAVAPNGVVKINPETGERTLVIQNDAAAIYGAISKNGLVAVLPMPDNTLAFYNLSDLTLPTQTGVLDLNEQGPFPIAFSDDEHFFMRTGVDVAWFYNIPTPELPVATPVAVMSITD